MKILLTGGAGFIGSAVIRELLAYTTYTVINLDKLTYAACPEALEPLATECGERYHFVQADICDAQAVQQVQKLKE